MTSKRHAVIWTRRPEGPVKMGNLVVSERENRFTYDDGFLKHTDIGGLSLMAPPALYKKTPVVYENREMVPLYPRLMSMIPGHQPHNIQRKLYNQILQKRKPPPKPGLDTDWELLLLTGHNGVGHIDIFESDQEADKQYHLMSDKPEIVSRSDFWHFVKDDILDAVDLVPAEVILKLLGPTPSVGGMIPKILASVPITDNWDGRFAPPGTRQIEDVEFKDVVLKFEQPTYEGMLALEALGLDIHRQLGFQVPEYQLAEFDGIRMLAVDRFDRSADGLPIPLETFFSVMAIGNREIQGATDTTMAAVGRMIEKLATLVNLDARQVQHGVYRRFCTALMTGNGDLHLENLSFLGSQQHVQLSPVYDPAPMRAWPLHNLLSAVPFDINPDLGGIRENIVALGPAFGMSVNAATDMLENIASETKDYTAQVAELADVPKARRDFLCKVVREARGKLVSQKVVHRKKSDTTPAP